jgi:cellulose synthase (UDP-forming)
LPGNVQAPLRVHDTTSFFVSLFHKAWRMLHTSDQPESGGLTAGGTPDAVIEGIESPYDIGGNRSIVAIHLRDASTFEPFISTFLNVQQSSDVSGSVSVLHGTEFQSSSIGAQIYHVGVLPWWMQVRLWAAEYPWLIAVVVVILAFLFALCARQWLRSKARARLTMLEN